MMRTTVALLLSLVVLQHAGAEEKRPPAEAGKVDEVTVEVQSWDGLQKFVRSRKDQVVVVDVWSSWCTPCVRELPHLVELVAERPRSVVGVTFCLDYNGASGTTAESAKPGALKVLRKVNAKRLVNFVSSDADETVYGKLDLGAVPAVLVYRNGKLLEQFDNDSGDYGDEGFTYEGQVGPFVEKVLGR